jgi:hypothetical protein
MEDDHDYFSDIFEWDANGNKRRKRVLRPGDSFSFSMTMQDGAAGGFRPFFADGSPDHTSPHRPGFRFSDTNDPLRQKANEAYEDRKRRAASAWKKRAPQPQSGRRTRGGVGAPQPWLNTGSDSYDDEGGHDNGRQRTLAQLQALRDGAWEDRRIRASNAWRNR